ncbi:LLM class flavin-dependent oxidoreductase [Frondihabitans cladoniiphilus]|uniref:LLM class flavin-dependent oxidoreductase n=1 Tax=Frondihabitans cladoniiphilus TaxID=715785 RepID=A0ABP8VVV5_9MICO
MTGRIRIALALEGAGWHPAAWRDEDARPGDLRTLGLWRDLVRTAESGGVDFVTIEDSFLLQGADRGTAGIGVENDVVRGRLDALLIASAVAPLTSRIGLVPTVTTTHTEPFHVATSLQTLDHTSRGRAGWRVQASPRPAEAALFGRREFPDLSIEQFLDPAHAHLIRDLFDEAGDVIDVVRLLWDSWEEDAVIRDLPTGRYIDRERIHNAEFEGRWFSVKGASIVPRPPQGQLPVTLLAHRVEPYELAARGADVVYVTPKDDASATSILDEVRQAEARVGRTGARLEVYADLLVLLEDSTRDARAALDRLDSLAGSPLVSDAVVLATTVDLLVDRLRAWSDLGYAGFRLRPARLPADLVRIAEQLVPALDRAGLHDSSFGGDTTERGTAERGTLRDRLGLEPAPNRYTSARLSAEDATISPNEVLA